MKRFDHYFLYYCLGMLSIHLMSQATDKKLLDYVKKGKVEKVKTLLEQNKDRSINKKIGGKYLVFKTLTGHHDATLKLLIDYGLDINLISEETGLTPAMMAAKQKHMSTLKVLLDSKDFNPSVGAKDDGRPVSYTHLTLPTIYSV